VIFVTVGSQLPFDRLVRGVDTWCASNPNETVFAQIADPGPRGYYPGHMEWERFLDPEAFDRRFTEAALIVAHAGMGSIIGALMAPKPIVIMPRWASLGEHRNDHQLTTISKFRDLRNVYPAVDEGELPDVLDTALLAGQNRNGSLEPLSATADKTLVDAVRRVVTGRVNDDAEP